MTELTRLQRFLASRDTTIDDVFWNAFLAVLETRFGAIETVTAGYEAAKEALVQRGLTAVQQQLALIVAELNSTVAAAQASLLVQVTAAQADAAAVEATAVAIAESLGDLQDLADALETQIQEILENNNLPAAGVTVSTIATLTATDVQAALAEIVGEHNSYAAATSALIGTLTSDLSALEAAHIAHVAAANPHGTTAGDVSAVPVSRQVTTSGLAQGGGTLSADRTITVPKAVAADVRAATADDRAATPKSFADAMAEVALTDGASIAWDMAAGFDFAVTLAGNRALANPANVTVGKSGHIRVVQDATGSRTLSFGSNFKFVGGAAAVLSTAANAEDYLFYKVVSATKILISAGKDFR